MPEAPQIRRHMESLRRDMVRAIHEKNPEEVKSGLDLYLRLLGTFYEQMKSLGVALGPKEAQAESESGWLIPHAGWQEIDWVQDDYRRILEEAFASPHKEILGWVLYFPYQVAGRAVREGDYLTIRKFLLDFATYPYALTLRLQPSDLQELALAKLTGYPRDFVRLHLSSLLEKASSEDDVERILQVAEGLVLNFGAILKTAYDEGRSEDARRFLETLRPLFSGVFWEIPGMEDWRLSERIGEERLPPHRSLPRSVEVYERFAAGTKHLRRYTSVIRFGLRGWILGRVQNGDPSESEITGWLDLLGTCGDFSELVATYLASLSHETQNRLGWDWWVMGGTEGRAISISHESMLDRAFLLEVAGALRDGLPAVTITDVEDGRTLSYASEGHLKNSAADVVARWDNWQSYLPVEKEQFEEGVSQLLTGTVSRFEDFWRERVLEAQLDPKRIAAFRDAFLRGYSTASQLKKLYGQLGRVELLEPGGPDQGGEWRGFNRLLPKEYFVEDANVLLDPLAEDYGRQLRRDEERSVFAAVLRSAGERRYLDAGVPALSEVRVAVTRAEGMGLSPLILIVNSWRAYDEMAQSGGLELDGSLAIALGPEVSIGRWDGVPVYRLHLGRRERVIVTTKERVGWWSQTKPDSGRLEETLESVDDRIKFALEAVSEETAERWVTANPEGFGSDASGERLETEDAIRSLMQRVRFRAYTNVRARSSEGAALLALQWPER